MIHLIHPDHQNNITQVTSKNSQQGRNFPTIILSFARIDPRGIVWLYQYITHTLPSSGQEQNDMPRSDLICAETALCLRNPYPRVQTGNRKYTHSIWFRSVHQLLTALWCPVSIVALSHSLYFHCQYNPSPCCRNWTNVFQTSPSLSLPLSLTFSHLEPSGQTAGNRLRYSRR